MVGIVLVSHSRALALAVEELVRSMTGTALPLVVAAGVGENRKELGTDAAEISEAIISVHGPDGVLVLMDMGSAILSAETALEFLDDSQCTKVKFCAAPFIEGAVAAGVTANLGASMKEVYREAMSSLKQKESALSSNETTPIASTAQSVTEPDAPEQDQQTIRLKVPNIHGLHARPAARLINGTRPFESVITIRNLSNQRGPVSVKSLSSLASLEILHDNEIEIAAVGKDAAAALEKIGQLIKSGLGDDLSSGTETSVQKARETLVRSQDNHGGPIPVSDGIAIGPVLYLNNVKPEIPQNKTDDSEAEIRRLQKAISSVQESLTERRDQMSIATGSAHGGIYGAQILALQDPELVDQAFAIIRTEKTNAALAWDRATQRIVDRYQALQDVYLRQRAADLDDAGRQVLELLVEKKPTALALVESCVVIADDLTPYQISVLDRKLALGVILLDGGPTSHVSILLKALGIPTVVQARSVFADIDLGRLRVIALDGASGKIWPDPNDKLLAELQDRQAQQRQHAEEERKNSDLPGATLDGTRCEIFANIGHASEAEAALQVGAEGVGLLRTEFLFLERNSAPTEEEQVQALREVGQKMAGRPVIVRTLDIGGDKEVPYLPMTPEANPFLGVRAIRLCFVQEDLFATQLRAILRAGHGHDFRIMFPMIANLSDLDRVLIYLEQAHRDLEAKQVPHLWPIQKGIMIEIPSAALQAEALAQRVDFFSVGTNDLTQYTLAADRGNPSLSSYQDTLHPSVLRLIEMVVNGARKHDRLVAVCGESASDDLAARIFIGLGIRELSMASAKIPRIKAALRKQKLDDLRQLAQKALSCRTAEEVRALSA